MYRHLLAIWDSLSTKAQHPFFPITIYWESSAEEKVCEFHESGSICECFLALFILAGIFLHEIV